MPVHAPGIRRDPPISVPTPRGLPRNEIKADSPPDDPPGVSFRFFGFNVLDMLAHLHQTSRSQDAFLTSQKDC